MIGTTARLLLSHLNSGLLEPSHPHGVVLGNRHGGPWRVGIHGEHLGDFTRIVVVILSSRRTLFGSRQSPQAAIDGTITRCRLHFIGLPRTATIHITGSWCRSEYRSQHVAVGVGVHSVGSNISGSAAYP